MKICLAQTRPVAGDVNANISGHMRMIDLAVEEKAQIIIFPELSVTGYEPRLAAKLATGDLNLRVDAFQYVADENHVTIVVGLPINTDGGLAIGMRIFFPGKNSQSYCKQYLHSDELPYFVPGTTSLVITTEDLIIAPAICYEISVPAHAEKAREENADIYMVSAAKTDVGIKMAYRQLAAIASQNEMLVVLANCVGRCDDMDCAGRSAIWNQEGLLLDQLDDRHEGALLLDTATMEISKRIIVSDATLV